MYGSQFQLTFLGEIDPLPKLTVEENFRDIRMSPRSLTSVFELFALS